MKDIILIGGGGHCKSAIEVIESAGLVVAGILDKRADEMESVLGYPVLGNYDDLSQYVDKYLFLITVGNIKNADVRVNIYNHIIKSGGSMATIISPFAHVSKHAQIGEGTIVMHNACINAEARVGNNVIVNTFANIEHDCFVDDFCHISTGAMLNGGSQVGKRSFLGSGSVVGQYISICSDVVVGAGGAVCGDITEKGIYAGVPVKRIK